MIDDINQVTEILTDLLSSLLTTMSFIQLGSYQADVKLS